MALYDGNQLPENPTSTFQLLVSLLYALMMTFYMSLGGFAAWATHKQLAHSPCDKACEGCPTIGQLQHPTHYASDLVDKHNAITRGLLAFIPAVFSLAHLYTSSLHSSTLYSAGNVIFAALLGYSAFFMGKTLHQLVADADRMDTTKAVYESLYMLASTYDRLCRHKKENNQSCVDSIFRTMEEARTPTQISRRTPSGPAWQSPWVLLNNFLAVAAQDDARVWAMFSAWLRRFQMSNLTMGLPSTATMRTATMRREVWDFLVWPAWLKALLPKWARHTCDDARHKMWLANVGLAYWLYSQNITVRTITGSMVVQQGIMDEMLLAGCRSHQLFYTASGYLRTLSDHVVKNLQAVAAEKDVVFMTKTGRELHLKVLSLYFDRIFHEEQAQKLSMACERYICRLTPAFGSLCLPTVSLVPQLCDCWRILFGQPLPASDLLDKDPGYWCRLWLAYMHVVLLGADLLRMQNNKQYFKEAQSEAGALKILRTATPDERRQIEALQQQQQQQRIPSAGNLVSAVDAVAEAVRADVSIEFSTLHDLSDGDLYSLAAFVATLLLRHRMREEWGQDPVAAAAAAAAAAQSAINPDVATNSDAGMLAAPGAEEAPRSPVNLCDIETYRDKLSAGPSRPDETTTYGDYLCSRGDLVRTHSSLPAIVEGVECLSASDWCLDVMRPLLTWLVVSGLTATVAATIACSHGVFLVTVSGAVQALAAWALMLHMDQLPQKRDLAGSIRGPPSLLLRAPCWLCLFVLWLCELLLRPVWLAVQVLCFLLTPNWRLFWVMQGFRVCGRLCYEAAAKGPTHLRDGVAKRSQRDVEKGSTTRDVAAAGGKDGVGGMNADRGSSACAVGGTASAQLWLTKLPAVWPVWAALVTLAEAALLFWIPALPHSVWWSGLVAVQWLSLAVLPLAVLSFWLSGCSGDSKALQLREARKFAVWLVWACCLAVTGASLAVWWGAQHASLGVGPRAWQFPASLVLLVLSTAPVVLVGFLVLGIFSVIGCVLQFVWLRVIEDTWWWLQDRWPALLGSVRPPLAATETAAAALAAAVTVAATAKQAAAAAREASLIPPEDLKPAADPLPEEEEEDVKDVEKVLSEVMAVEEAAIRASVKHCKGPATDKAVAAGLNKAFDLLDGMRATATQRLLLLSCEGISLLSCFEQERRHFYKDRIKPWNVAVNIISPLFFYTFLVLLLLALWQEPWYARHGMCLGRCGNGSSDCMADQNIGLKWFDNAHGAPLGLSHLVTSVTDPASIKPPECPGTGSFVQGGRGDSGCQCPWMNQVLDVTVLQPVAFAASANSTLCRAEVRLVNPVTGEAPKKGTAVPAVWYSMTGGKNDDSSLQLGEKMVGLTNSSGYAAFTSPVSKPFNGSSGHGCNLTVLASEVTSFVVHDPTGSGLHNSKQWP